MGKLIFIGLGLGDERGITLKGLEAARACDVLFMESYTSMLEEGSAARLEERLGREITMLERGQVETGSLVVETAAGATVGFLVPGDSMSATTHLDLRLRAHGAGIPTEVIHGVSVLTAVPGLLGLQNYKFGRTITIPFPEPNFRPISFYEKALDNFRAGMHTLCLLDIRASEGKYMTANRGLQVLADIEAEMNGGLMTPERLVCVVARAGSDDALAMAGSLESMLEADFGPPLHTLVIPGELHFLEARALVVLAGAPDDIAE